MRRSLGDTAVIPSAERKYPRHNGGTSNLRSPLADYIYSGRSGDPDVASREVRRNSLFTKSGQVAHEMYKIDISSRISIIHLVRPELLHHSCQSSSSTTGVLNSGIQLTTNTPEFRESSSTESCCLRIPSNLRYTNEGGDKRFSYMPFYGRLEP